jgi:PAS domain S-box-containing protein
LTPTVTNRFQTALPQQNGAITTESSGLSRKLRTPGGGSSDDPHEGPGVEPRAGQPAISDTREAAPSHKAQQPTFHIDACDTLMEMRAGSGRSGEVACAGAGDGWRMLFWMAFAHSANPMSLVTRQRRFVAVNRAFVSLSGYTREQLVGAGVDLVLAPEELPSLDAEWRELERLGDVERERTIVTPDGRRLEVQYARRRVCLDSRDLALAVIIEASHEPICIGASDSSAASALTPREIEIVGHVAMGQRAHEIAAELGIAENTVKTHLRNAMRKAGARSQAQLVALVFCGQIPASAIPT